MDSRESNGLRIVGLSDVQVHDVCDGRVDKSIECEKLADERMRRELIKKVFQENKISKRKELENV